MAIKDLERTHLAQADRHIADGKTLIARQKEIVRRIAERGQPTDWAEDTLHALESSLRAFEQHRETIISMLNADQQR